MIGTLLITLSTIVLTGFFATFFDEIIGWADKLVKRLVKAVRAILVIVRKKHRVLSKLYTRYTNDKITVSTSEKEIDIDDIEDEKIRKKLMKKKEVEIKEYA
jgi:hypothetical protein